MQSICLIFPKSTFLIDPLVYPPLGLWYLAAQLEAQGHVCDFRDLSLDPFPADGEFDQVWISATSPQMYEVRRLANITRVWKKTAAVLGGAAPWARPDECRALGFDLVVSGESDHPDTVREIVSRAWSEKGHYSPAITPGPINWALPPARRWDGKYHSRLEDKTGVAHSTATLFTSRGCPMACAFCIAGSQRVLMADWTYKSIEDVKIGDMVMAYHDHDTTRNQGYAAPTRVTYTKSQGYKQTIEICAGDAVLRCTPDHKIYVDDGHKTRWKRAGSSIPGRTSARVFLPREEFTDDYKRGWCAGYIAGDGCVHARNGQTNITVASRDSELLDVLTEWAALFGCTLRRFEHNFGPGAFPTKYEGGTIDAVQCTSGPESDDFLREIGTTYLDKRDYMAGWLAGMYDADGQIDRSGTQCRIHQSFSAKPFNTIRIEEFLTELSLHFTIQKRDNGMNIYCIPAAPFLTFCRPVLQRKYLDRYGYKGLEKRAIDDVLAGDFETTYDITTEAHSFICEGFIVHNCESGRNGIIWSRAVRYEPTTLVDRQLQGIVDRGHTGVMFYDDILPLNKPRTLALLELLKKYNLIWRCFLRTDVICHQGGLDYLREMAEGGLVEVLAGVESADNRIKANVHKGTTIEQDTQVLAWCRQLGVKFKASFILGLPGEDAESMERTREWILRERPDRVDVNALIPFPGTPLTTHPADYLGVDYDVEWEEQLPEEFWFKGPRSRSNVIVSTSHLSSLQISEFRDKLMAEIEAAEIPY